MAEEISRKKNCPKKNTRESSNSKIKDRENLMDQLYKEVENADRNVKDIVLKAIEGSGRYPSHEKFSKKLKTQDPKPIISCSFFSQLSKM